MRVQNVTQDGSSRRDRAAVHAVLSKMLNSEWQSRVRSVTPELALGWLENAERRIETEDSFLRAR